MSIIIKKKKKNSNDYVYLIFLIPIISLINNKTFISLIFIIINYNFININNKFFNMKIFYDYIEFYIIMILILFNLKRYYYI